MSQRDRRAQLLKDLEAPDAPRDPDGPADSDPAAPLARAACKAGDARKAREVSALRVSHLTSATSFFVSMVGSSKAQITAIVKNVEDELEEEFGRIGRRQGKAISGWVCLDYDAVVVNVFSEAARAKLSEMELSYLMQIVFRVFLKPGTRDPTCAKCYIVQALISPGVNHNELIADLRSSSFPPSQEAPHQQPRPAEPHFVATSEDLTLEMVDEFLKRTLAHHGR